MDPFKRNPKKSNKNALYDPNIAGSESLTVLERAKENEIVGIDDTCITNPFQVRKALQRQVEGGHQMIISRIFSSPERINDPVYMQMREVLDGRQAELSWDECFKDEIPSATKTDVTDNFKGTQSKSNSKTANKYIDTNPYKEL